MRSNEPVHANDLGQPVGFPVEGWMPPSFPPDDPMVGRLCRLERLDVDRHAAALYSANSSDATGGGWTYLSDPPPRTREEYAAWATRAVSRADVQFWTIIVHATGLPAGVAAYMRITPAAGSIEVGHVHYSPQLQRTPAATEAMFLMMRRVFTLGYRRYEWKCHALNASSRAAAERLGFSFEGVFRQALVVKGRNRDTAWYSVIDRDWPLLKRAFERWLEPSNFDAGGLQRISLRSLTAPLLAEKG